MNQDQTVKFQARLRTGFASTLPVGPFLSEWLAPLRPWRTLRKAGPFEWNDYG